jgi:hypothetical protein
MVWWWCAAQYMYTIHVDECKEGWSVHGAVVQKSSEGDHARITRNWDLLNSRFVKQT